MAAMAASPARPPTTMPGVTLVGDDASSASLVPFLSVSYNITPRPPKTLTHRRWPRRRAQNHLHWWWSRSYLLRPDYLG